MQALYATQRAAGTQCVQRLCPKTVRLSHSKDSISSSKSHATSADVSVECSSAESYLTTVIALPQEMA